VAASVLNRRLLRVVTSCREAELYRRQSHSLKTHSMWLHSGARRQRLHYRRVTQLSQTLSISGPASSSLPSPLSLSCCASVPTCHCQQGAWARIMHAPLRAAISSDKPIRSKFQPRRKLVFQLDTAVTFQRNGLDLRNV